MHVTPLNLYLDFLVSVCVIKGISISTVHTEAGQLGVCVRMCVWCVVVVVGRMGVEFMPDTPQSFYYTPQNIKSHISNQGGEKLLVCDFSASDSHVSSCLYVSNCG